MQKQKDKEFTIIEEIAKAVNYWIHQEMKPVDLSDDEFSSENESVKASRMEIEPSRNYMDVSKVSAAAIRYGVSTRAAAAISTAALITAKEAGLINDNAEILMDQDKICLLYTSPSPRDGLLSRMPSSA